MYAHVFFLARLKKDKCELTPKKCDNKLQLANEYFINIKNIH